MPNCDECKHCAARATDPNNILAEPELECRRYPPQINVVPTPQGAGFFSSFPTVNKKMLCSEFLPLTSEPPLE